MNLDRGQIVAKYVSPRKGWTGHQTSKLVLPVGAHEMDVDMLAEVLHRLPEHQVVHQLVKILLEVAGHLFSELGVHPDVGLHPGALLKEKSLVDLLQAHA